MHPYKWEAKRFNTDIQGGEGGVAMEAEIGAMRPPAKECWQPLEAGGGRLGSLWRLWQEAQPYRHLGFKLQIRER